MKKVKAIILALACVLSLVGCGSKDTAPAAGTPLATFYQAVLDAQSESAEELIFFEESNPDLIGSLYPGLLDIELNQQAFYMPPIIMAPCEIVLVEVKNADDVQRVADIFQARIDNGADDTSYPENAAGWSNNAKVHQSGNFVGMIVLPNGYSIPKNIFELS